MPIYGTIPTNQTVAPQLVISGLESMAEQFDVDPSLPVLGQDPFLPNSDLVTIARGRLLGVKNPQLYGSQTPTYNGVMALSSAGAAANTTYTMTGKALLTLANGSEGQTSGSSSTDVYPIGFAETHYFRNSEEHPQPWPGVTKGKLVSLPYVQTSNGAYGMIKPGDYVTAYYGTTSTGAVIAQEVGKVVKFIEKTMYSAHQAASTTITLTGAVYPAFVPKIVFASNAGAYVAPTSTLAYVGNSWQATFGSNVTDVIFMYGQTLANRAGQCISFQAVGNPNGYLTAPNAIPGWLDWVKDNYDAWTIPPLTLPRPATQVLNENVYTNAIGPNTYRLQQYPIVPTRTVAVYLTGTRTDPNTGVTTSITPTANGAANPLPLATNTWQNDFCYGQDYVLNPLTGVLTISSDISNISTLTVSYSADLTYLDGKIWNPGQLGLTDGRYSGQPGTPANLELIGVLADMHVAIF